MSVVHILVSACFCAVHVCVCEHWGYILNLDWLYKLGVSVVICECMFLCMCVHAVFMCMCVCVCEHWGLHLSN